jgi:hypothetical protein
MMRGRAGAVFATVASTASCSFASSAAASPVEPQTTKPAMPEAASLSVNAASAAWSTAPLRKGVTSGIQRPEKSGEGEEVEGTRFFLGDQTDG